MRDNPITPQICHFIGILRPESFLCTAVQFIVMGRKKGFDQLKISAILQALINNPDGIWLRRIAIEVRLSPATVSHYINSVLQPLVEDVSLGDSKKPLLRVYKLKPFVFQKLSEGKDLNQILKLIKLMDDIG